MPTYHIVRFHRHGRPRRLPGKSGLTLEQAQAHCHRPDTRGGISCQTHGRLKGHPTHCPTCGERTDCEWFDGYSQD